MRRTPALGLAALLTAALLPLSASAEESELAAREAEPVILTGAHLPAWSRLPAQGVADTYPAGTSEGDRDAHHGTLTVPPDARQGVPVEEIAAYRFDAGGWVEIPIQVDERFPYFLANGSSDFGFYSTVDEELTYAWDEESWLKTAGECAAAYPDGVGPTADPVPTLDDDDEIVLMASDAGTRAPDGTPGPPGTGDTRQEVALGDPLGGPSVGWVYLFRRPGGSSFDETTGYVRYGRDADADEWIDRHSFTPDDPEKLGSSNTGYGPNLSGTVCRTAQFAGGPPEPDGTPRQSTDRFSRDGVTVTTDGYRWRATGRWMIRDLRVAQPGQPGVYGPDLIDRWKGRAFQQSPDSSISVVGFEDEQVNWEANSVLLGERAGPVRAIRETWGADSGTNVTKTETFYRDAVVYRYRVRVHPIPPDGLYTSWDYNAGVADTYFNALKPEGVAIDGENDDVGNVDEVAGQPAFFDAPDPTFDLPLALYRWEQVSGEGDAGSLVYLFELMSPTSAGNPAVVPYYRDDACLDDGTGDDPVQRPWPGEASTDQRVRDGYAAQAGKPYGELACAEKQGAWGSHGVHFFVTGDTDNAFGPKPSTEIDAQQWQFAVPTAEPAPVGERYAQSVRAKLIAVAVEQESEAASEPEREATSVAISVPPRRDWKNGDDRVTATLTDAGGAPIAAREIDFFVDGRLHATAVTDVAGEATAPTEKGWDDQTRISAVWDGDDTYLPSSVEVTYHPGRGASGSSG